MALTKTFTIWGQHFTSDCVRYFIFNLFAFIYLTLISFKLHPHIFKRICLPHTTHDVLFVDLLQYLVVESGTT